MIAKYPFSRTPLVAYQKGGERERFNPLTGARYDRLQSHDMDIDDQDSTPASTSTSNQSLFPSRNVFGPNRGRTGFFRGGEEGSRWKGKWRSNSPYQKVSKEATVKVVENNAKTKEKP